MLIHRKRHDLKINCRSYIEHSGHYCICIREMCNLQFTDAESRQLPPSLIQIIFQDGTTHLNQMLSRAKPALDNNASPVLNEVSDNADEPRLEKFIVDRDYVGAITLLDFLKSTTKSQTDSMFWAGYSWFHLGEYHQAVAVLKQ